jgi:hypothetical protein
VDAEDDQGFAGPRARERSSSYSWYARAKPLPFDKLVAVRTMVHPDNCWRPSDWSVAVISTVQGRPDIMGVRIGDRILFSERYVDLDGITAYRFKPAVSGATFAQAAEQQHGQRQIQTC